MPLMQRLLRVLAAVLLILGVAVLGTETAQADDEHVRSLDVQFDLNPDGSMDVRYKLDWHFGETGRRGIIFSIVTRENWEPDPSQDAMYRVEDLNVSSPSGAPASYTTSVTAYDSDETLDVRIGDPNVSLDTEDATYVITYRIHDVMREFDGIPELQWDVLSDDYPPIKNLNVRLTAPEGVDQVGCETGTTQCDARLVDGAAEFSGTDITAATTIYAQLPAGSITNSQPHLERRRLSFPELLKTTNELTVDSDGVVHARHEMSYEVPAEDDTARLRFALATRLPWSDDHDHVLEYRNLTARDKNGQALDIRPGSVTGRGSTQEQAYLVSLDIDKGDIYQTVEVTYEVEGAVIAEDGVAAMRLPFSVTSIYAEPSVTTLTMPGDVTAVTCWDPALTQSIRECRRMPEHKIEGDTVTVTTEDTTWMFPTLISPQFDAAALTGDLPPLQQSYDKLRDQYRSLGWATGVGGAGLLAALGVTLGRFGGGFDKRFANVAPGLVDPGGVVRRAKRTDEVPVAFSPPDIPLHLAGLLRDRYFKPSHLAAVLVQLAVLGAVKLQSKPLAVAQLDDSMELTTVQRSVLQRANKTLHPLSERNARHMRKAITDSQEAQSVTQNWFQLDTDVKRIVAILGAIAAVTLGALFWLNTWDGPAEEMASPGRTLIIIGAIVGVVIAFKQKRRAPLTAQGRAMLDQIEGFRTYLATAEAEQLAFEADEDIFQRYLPWAVLFDLTERWTQVCQELADQGRIATPDFAFVAGAASVSDFSHSIGVFTSSIGNASAPVSAGSGSGGGSSGFSGGGFSGGGGGGGGGGGTSASSW